MQGASYRLSIRISPRSSSSPRPAICSNEQPTMRRPSPHIVGYVYVLIALLVAISVAALGTVMIQHRLLEKEEAEADDYHVSSMRHAAALGNEVLQIKALLLERADGKRGVAPYLDSSGVAQQLFKSVSRITGHLEELHALEHRHSGHSMSTPALQRAERQVLALVGSTKPLKSSLAFHEH